MFDMFPPPVDSLSSYWTMHRYVFNSKTKGINNIVVLLSNMYVKVKMCAVCTSVFEPRRDCNRYALSMLFQLVRRSPVRRRGGATLWISAPRCLRWWHIDIRTKQQQRCASKNALDTSFNIGSLSMCVTSQVQRRFASPKRKRCVIRSHRIDNSARCERTRDLEIATAKPPTLIFNNMWSFHIFMDKRFYSLLILLRRIRCVK